MSDPNYGVCKTPEGHTTRLIRAKTLDVFVGDEVIKFPVVNVSKGTFEVFMHTAYESGSNEGYCRMTSFKGKHVRLIDFNGAITVSGYWKGQFFPGKEDYELGPTDNRWETIQAIPKNERARLEKFLKKEYKTVHFWP